MEELTTKQRIIDSITKEISLAANAVLLLNLYQHLPDAPVRGERGSIEEKIANLINNSPYLVSITNSLGYFICVNDTWLREFGWTFHEMTSKPFFEYIHPDDIQKSLTAMEDVSIFRDDIQKYKTFENRYRTKSGEYKTVKWHIHNEYDPGKEVFTSIAELG